MFNLGGGEIIVIAILALIVLGPERLPSAARDVGKMMTELRSISRGFRDELKTAVDLDALERQSVEELAAEAEAFKRGDAHVAQRPPAGQAAGANGGASAHDDRGTDGPPPVATTPADGTAAPDDPGPASVDPRIG